ncbi:MAG TPA: acetyl-CoA carboxylase biotin carboxylase subunit, partial [Blastocatellia bacterium]|nr:acetyl-CoA carboxylase biotin carboxylase subunit [Blastocatellia bacterium]
MFKKLLIANRGEIAVRIARACREMGISPVAVFSDADRASLHVRASDEAIHIGPAPSAESYLRIDRIIDAARRVGAEAIHPGYGFLSENADFAEAVESAGLVLVGPPASAMQIMGSKTSARAAAIEAGAPVVPGTTSAVASVEEARAVGEQTGYPVMLKAAAGGGGKGMRLVRSREEMQSAFDLARAEALSSFKDASVYIEKYIERPRHIEIQLMADRHGNVVHLGERECSLQRRHQKVLEECPSPVVTPELRRRMGESAVNIARAAGYVNAGTIEFLVDRELNFYFLEMNTRLQVEHPVTELVTGRDLVHEQIRVAAGERLSFSQEDVVMRGSAIECRIYAEDPDKNFLPSPGVIKTLVVPQGPGIRYDGGSYKGWEVPIYYDPLLAKLCVWAETREMAIRRLARALDEYAVEGIHTTLPFFRAVVRNAEFQRGEFDTGFIDDFLSRKREDIEPQHTERVDEEARLRDIAAIAAVLHTKASATVRTPDTAQSAESRWKLYSRMAQRRL